MTEKEFDEYSETIAKYKKSIENYEESIKDLKKKISKCKNSRNTLDKIIIDFDFIEEEPKKECYNYCYTPLSNNILDNIISYMEKDLSFYEESLSITKKYLKEVLNTISAN